MAGDRLTMVSGGGMPPLLSDVDWLVSLEGTPAGVSLTAMPLDADRPDERRVSFVLNGVTGFEVRAFGGRPVPRWREAWSDQSPPLGVSITYRTATGQTTDVIALPRREW